jgi:ribosome-binding protein aMBF1 (putative translation factor)
VITGAQIRHARELLGWSRFQLAQHAKLHPAIVERGEEAAGAVPITAYQLALLRNALEAAGVEFTGGDEPGVRLNARGKRAK